MKSLSNLFLIIALLLQYVITAQDSTGIEKPVINGYIKYLPSIRMSKKIDEFYFDQLLHNRFNVRWQINKNLHFQGALRSRAFQGYNVKNIPFYSEFINQENGYFNASWILLNSNELLIHTTSDRFFLDYTYKKWHIRAGRQRINWGINMVSNPNDLFNVYSFFDFDYEERPGTDAIRVQYFANALSRFEVAYSPGKTAQESVAAMLYSFNYKKYDLQFITGYFRNRLALGTGWAGSIKNTGFKGEVTFFSDLEHLEGRQKNNVVIAASADHRFGNGAFFIFEYLYNQPRTGVETNLLFFTQPLRADNLSFTDHALFLNYSYPVSPILNTGLAGFYYPGEQGMFFSPNINYSIKQNLDLLLISQIFFGPKDGLLSQAGYLIATAVKWSF